MAINANVPSKSEGKVAPAGNHIARVYRIIHIGTVPDEYQGQAKDTDKVRISFELPNEKDVFKEGDEPKPYTISQDYGLYMGDKANLRKLVEGILGIGFLDEDAKTFDVIDLIGRACMINVVQKTSSKGKLYAKIVSAAPLPKGIEAPTPVNAPYLLDYDTNWSPEKFAEQPDFIREAMATSREYKQKMGVVEAKTVQDVKPGDLPF